MLRQDNQNISEENSHQLELDKEMKRQLNQAEKSRDLFREELLELKKGILTLSDITFSLKRR